MRYFLSKQVHSSSSSSSSNDVILKREIQKGVADVFSAKIYREKVISKNFGFTVYYVEEDKTFYARGRIFNDYSKTEEFQVLIAKYESEGWLRTLPWLESKQKEHWAAEEEKEKQKRIKQGYVIPAWSPDIPVKDYQGGFSDAVFNQEKLQEYLKGKGCHGYIGHSVRKKNIDAYIETRFIATARPICILEHLEPESLLAVWLTSTDGRHFGDSLEGISFEEQKVYVDGYVIKMYNTSFIYSLPEHNGMMESSDTLREKFASKLLPE